MSKDQCEKKIGKVVHRLDKMLGRNLSASARQAGIDEATMVHGWILRYLYENRDRDIFQKDLEQEFGVGRSSVTTTIQTMERNGCLRREAVPWDARLKKVVLTEKGEAVQEQMNRFFDGLNAKTVEGILPEEMEIFFRVVKKLEENLERQQKERETRKEDSDASDNIKGSKRV